MKNECCSWPEMPIFGPSVCHNPYSSFKALFRCHFCLPQMGSLAIPWVPKPLDPGWEP